MRMPSFVIASLLIGSPVMADVIVFQQGNQVLADLSVNTSYQHVGSHIRQGAANTNYGTLASGHIVVGRISNATGAARGVLGFDLSAIPTGSIINSVTLTFNIDSASPSSTDPNIGDLELRLILPGASDQIMLENQVTWNLRQTGNNWTTAGGDLAPAALSTIAGFPITLTTSGKKVFGSTPNFVAAVQAARNTNAALELAILSPTTEAQVNGSINNFIRISSDDNTTISLRPMLTVDYVVPEPGTMTLTGLGCIAILARRRQHD